MNVSQSYSTVINYIEKLITTVTILIVVSLIISIVPRINELAFPATLIIHVVIVFYGLSWLSELKQGILISELKQSTDNAALVILNGKKLESINSASRRAAQVLLVFSIQSLVINLVYFSAVIVYYNTIVAQIIIDKGFFFIIVYYIVGIGQIFVDIGLIISLSKCLKIFKDNK
jgi:hypothetical protein